MIHRLVPSFIVNRSSSSIVSSSNSSSSKSVTTSLTKHHHYNNHSNSSTINSSIYYGGGGNWKRTMIYTIIMISIFAGMMEILILMRSIWIQSQQQQQRNNSNTFLYNNNNHNKNNKIVIQQQHQSSIRATTTTTSTFSQTKLQDQQEQQQHQQRRGKCAINFFGLPRAYESLVLPSIQENIIQYNYDCDYYVHYYYMTTEVQGRSGNGGTIDPTAILLLRNAVHNTYKEKYQQQQTDGGTTTSTSSLPIVEFVYDTEEDFWNKYTTLIEKIRTTKKNGQYYYFPYKAKTYQHPVTTDNIIKMWHSIQSSYQLMERMAMKHNIIYDTVGMFRSDVVYVTPINIYDGYSTITNTNTNTNHQIQLPSIVTVPNFGKHPVSDRCIYGSRELVKIWSTQRFVQLEHHVEFIYNNDPGWGLHSERFVNYTLFPLILQNNNNNNTSTTTTTTTTTTIIRYHPTMCFFRARADESIWVSDCRSTSKTVASPYIMEQLVLPKSTLSSQSKAITTTKKRRTRRTMANIVEDAIGRKCSSQTPIKVTKTVQSLLCTTSTSSLLLTPNKNK